MFFLSPGVLLVCALLEISTAVVSLLLNIMDLTDAHFLVLETLKRAVVSGTTSAASKVHIR